MSNSLRSDFKQKLADELAIPLIDIPDRAVDSLLNLVASKMPEYHSRKKLHQMYKEDKITYETYSRELAVTDILDQVKSILKGETE